MKPLVLFPDPILATLTILRDRLPTYAPTAALGSKTPEDLGADYPGAPYVMVALDGAATDYPVIERATVRVSVWGTSDAAGLRLAQIARTLLLAYEGGPSVRSFGSIAGPIPTTDPESASPLSFFTVEARTRPTAL